MLLDGKTDCVHPGQWLFIIDGIITIPLALLAYIFLPHLPQSGVRTWWITEKEHELSIKRMASVGRAGKQKWTKAKVRKIVLSWHTYLLRKSSSSPSADLNRGEKKRRTNDRKLCCTSSGTTGTSRTPWATG